MNATVKELIKNLLKTTSNLGLEQVKADFIYKKISGCLKQTPADSLDTKTIRTITQAFIQSCGWEETIIKSQENELKKQLGKQIKALISEIFIDIKTPKSKNTRLSVHTSIIEGNPIAEAIFKHMKTRRASWQGNPEQQDESAFDEEDSASPPKQSKTHTLPHMQTRSSAILQAASSSPPVTEALSDVLQQGSQPTILVTSAEVITDDLERVDTKISSSPIEKSTDSTNHDSQIMPLRKAGFYLKDKLQKTSDPILTLGNNKTVPFSKIMKFLKDVRDLPRDTQQTSETVLNLANGDQVPLSEIMAYLRTMSDLKRDMQQTSNPVVDELMGILGDIENNPVPTTMDDEGFDTAATVNTPNSPMIAQPVPQAFLYSPPVSSSPIPLDSRLQSRHTLTTGKRKDRSEQDPEALSRKRVQRSKSFVTSPPITEKTEVTDQFMQDEEDNGMSSDSSEHSPLPVRHFTAGSNRRHAKRHFFPTPPGTPDSQHSPLVEEILQPLPVLEIEEQNQHLTPSHVPVLVSATSPIMLNASETVETPVLNETMNTPVSSTVTPRTPQSEDTMRSPALSSPRSYSSPAHTPVLEQEEQNPNKRTRLSRTPLLSPATDEDVSILEAIEPLPIITRVLTPNTPNTMPAPRTPTPSPGTPIPASQGSPMSQSATPIVLTPASPSSVSPMLSPATRGRVSFSTPSTPQASPVLAIEQQNQHRTPSPVPVLPTELLSPAILHAYAPVLRNAHSNTPITPIDFQLAEVAPAIPTPARPITPAEERARRFFSRAQAPATTQIPLPARSPQPHTPNAVQVAFQAVFAMEPDALVAPRTPGIVNAEAAAAQSPTPAERNANPVLRFSPVNRRRPQTPENAVLVSPVALPRVASPRVPTPARLSPVAQAPSPAVQEQSPRRASDAKRKSREESETPQLTAQQVMKRRYKK